MSATEGERWTSAELERLSAARFRPRAIGRFLLASQRRASRVRRRRPDVARREAAWAAAGAAAWLGLAAIGVEPFRRRTAAGLGGWVATVVMLDWHLGMLETPAGQPRNLGAADATTLLRAWLVPAVADDPTALLCLAGFASDALDGRLARATEPTRLGRDLEGLVDTAFAVAILRGARRRNALGVAATAAETARLAAGFAYAVSSYFAHARAPDARVLRAARAIAPLRAAGVVIAVSGRRRLGEPVLVAGSLASVAVVARELACATPLCQRS